MVEREKRIGKKRIKRERNSADQKWMVLKRKIGVQDLKKSIIEVINYSYFKKINL